MRTRILEDIESVTIRLLVIKVMVVGIIIADRQLVPRDREQLRFFELFRITRDSTFLSR